MLHSKRERDGADPVLDRARHRVPVVRLAFAGADDDVGLERRHGYWDGLPPTCHDHLARLAVLEAMTRAPAARAVAAIPVAASAFDVSSIPHASPSVTSEAPAWKQRRTRAPSPPSSIKPSRPAANGPGSGSRHRVLNRGSSCASDRTCRSSARSRLSCLSVRNDGRGAPGPVHRAKGQSPGAQCRSTLGSPAG
jgi:hypothetical protein